MSLLQSTAAGLRLCRTYAQYARAILEERTGKGVPVKVDKDIPLSVRGEIETMVELFYAAWGNKVRLEYSLDEALELITGEKSTKKKEDLLQETFRGPFEPTPDGGDPLVGRPTIFVDRYGTIVAWYLPGLFTQRRSERTIASLARTSSYPNSILRIPKTDSWRDRPDTFANPCKCVVEPGNVNLSVCWFSQGRGPRNGLPGPSASLKENQNNQGGPQLLEELKELNALIGAILHLVHPDLFELQMDVLDRLVRGQTPVNDKEIMLDLFDSWSTPFNGLAVITNRETPYHRDTKGGHRTFDIVVAFGDYAGGRFHIPLLSAHFVYGPGTGLIFPGFVFEHRASKTVGERVCLASYVRPNVGEAVFGAYDEPLLPTAKDLAYQYHLPLPEVVSKNIWTADVHS